MTHSFIDVKFTLFYPLIFFLIVAVAHLGDENETGLDISELRECHWF